MKPSIRTAVLGLLLVMSAATTDAIAKEPIRLDGSSDSAAVRSFKQMMDARPDARMHLAMAMLQLNMVGVSSAAEMMADPELRNPSIARVRDEVDGLTADEIIALAAATGVQTFMADEEPGIRADLLAPLSEGPAAWPLAGTTWLITSDINGHISDSTVQLGTDGDARVLEPDGRPGQVNAWQQSADEFLLSLNDEFVVYRGRLQGRSLAGTAGNVNGSVWSWTAEQLDPSSNE